MIIKCRNHTHPHAHAKTVTGKKTQNPTKSMEKRRRENNFYFNLLTSRKGIRRKSNKRVRKQDLFPRTSTKSDVGSQRDDFEYFPNDKTLQPLQERIEDCKILPEFLQSNLKLMRYAKFAPVQRYVIPVATSAENNNVTCCAPTGSGKTLAFMIPVLVRIHNEVINNNETPRRRFHNKAAAPLSLILAPTRELAIQIHTVSRRLLFREEETIRSVVVYGGSKIRPQLIELAIGCDILIATPGRLRDMQSRGIVSMKDVRVLVVDEADRMLDMGFRPDVDTIHNLCSCASRQTIMVSATFPDAVQNLASSYMKTHIFVRRKGETITNTTKAITTTTTSISATVTQRILRAETGSAREKFTMLVRLLSKDMSANRQVLVFVSRKDTAKWLSCELRRVASSNCFDEGEDYNNIWSSEIKKRVIVVEIDGDRKQAQRLSALKSFNDRKATIMIATDVASRGLDTVGVDHVVNWSLPTMKSEFVARYVYLSACLLSFSLPLNFIYAHRYVHRIGRTGRMGRSGIATSFYVPGDDEGNGGCASIGPFLHRILLSSQSKVPKWFEKLPEASVSLLSSFEEKVEDLLREENHVSAAAAATTSTTNTTTTISSNDNKIQESKEKKRLPPKRRKRKKKKKRKVSSTTTTPIASIQGTFAVPSDW
jgi:superfamily II DNA/RNA helicase